MTTFVPLSTQPVFQNGVATPNAQISVYNAGTLTPRTAYADGLLATPWAQPILSDVNGCIPLMWVVGNAYRVRIVAPNGALLRDVDNLPADTGIGAPPPPPPPPGQQTLTTGDMVWVYGTGPLTGRVRANGKTLGNAGSGASELAGANAQNLYVFLWNGDPNLVVIGGRGTTALADFNASKLLTLPDFRGRAPFCLDDAGSTPAGRLSGALFLSGSATALGSSGGESAHVLQIGELAVHTHTGTTQNSTSHQHTFTTGTVAAHNHTGATSSEQQTHYHTGTTDGEGQSHYHGVSIVTDNQGSHSHGGATGIENQKHSHNVTNLSGANYSVNPGANPVVAYWVGSGGTAPTNLDSVDHTHAIAADGVHAHNVIGNTGTESVAHTHTFTSGTEVGAHNHAIPADGSHNHTGTVDAAGIHNHSFTSDPTGSGTAHNTMPPFMLITAYLVL